MSKRKKAQFRLKNGETLIKKGAMNYSPLGGYGHTLMGTAYLTDSRFYYISDKEENNLIVVEIPFDKLLSVGKVGIPVLTRSLLLVTDEKSYRMTAFPLGGWYKKLTAAFLKEQLSHTEEPPK